jgi:FKBP-type peptidyl-prolyl cis-trans isomerase 2
MMEKVKANDFIEVEYTGMTKDDGVVFDTTDKAVAAKNQLHSHTSYGPVTICVGEEQILSGLDKNLIGKDLGQEYTINITPKEGFGVKNAKLIQMVPTKKFIQQKIQPIPGLQLNIDGMVGTVKTVSGGRTLVDFNHPLSGKELTYKLRINKKVTDTNQKLLSYMKLSLGQDDVEVSIKDGCAEVKTKVDIPEQAKVYIISKIKNILPEIKETDFKLKKEEKIK